MRCRSLLLLAAVVASGCFKTEMRGWNIYMTRQAVADARKPLDDAYDRAVELAEEAIRAEIPEDADEEMTAVFEKKIETAIAEIEADREASFEALEDAADRLDLAQRDFPGPKVKEGEEGPQRSKPGAINPHDEYMYNSYAGFVGNVQRRREALDSLKRPFRRFWDLLLLALDIAPFVVIALVVIYLGFKLSKLYLVVARVMKVAVKDKQKRKEIGAGTPVGAAYDKHKKKDEVLKEEEQFTIFLPPEPKPAPAPPPPPAPKPAPAPAPKPPAKKPAGKKKR